MTPVDQDKFNPTSGAPDTGNCLAACVATVLDLPLNEVPNFASFTGEWWYEMRNFVAIHGYHLAEAPCPMHGWAVGIGTVNSPRGDFHHAVVIRGEQVIHDPHPSKASLHDSNIFDVIYFIPFEIPGSLKEVPR